jgi:hypothetical protein
MYLLWKTVRLALRLGIVLYGIYNTGVANFNRLAIDLRDFLGCRDRPKKKKKVVNVCYSSFIRYLCIISFYILLFSKYNFYIPGILGYTNLQKKNKNILIVF